MCLDGHFISLCICLFMEWKYLPWTLSLDVLLWEQPTACLSGQQPLLKYMLGRE